MKTFRYVEGLPELTDITAETINGGRYYRTPAGIKLPSVTTVLGYSTRHSIQEWKDKVGHEEAQKISTRAANRGTKFHNMMEKYLRNDNTLFENVMPDMKQAFYDAKKVVDRIDNIHYIESPLYSLQIGLAGRTDVIAEFDGKLSIIDFKTSRKVKRKEWIENYFEQGTAYALMYEEIVGTPIDDIVIIISVDGETEPQVFTEQKYRWIDSLRTKIHAYNKDHRNVC